jgi:hypothetical protein
MDCYRFRNDFFFDVRFARFGGLLDVQWIFSFLHFTFRGWLLGERTLVFFLWEEPATTAFVPWSSCFSGLIGFKIRAQSCHCLFEELIQVLGEMSISRFLAIFCTLVINAGQQCEMETVFPLAVFSPVFSSPHSPHL